MSDMVTAAKTGRLRNSIRPGQDIGPSVAIALIAISQPIRQ
ncbi:hypothetical protein [Laspinema olomoucense]|nr:MULTISPECIES: hypothetical protein [unclassified Laspinema]